MPLLPGELAAMRQTQQVHMMDRCDVYTLKKGKTNARGYEEIRYVKTCECIQCGLQHSKPGHEAMLDAAEGTQVPMFDGQLRLPIGTEISTLDRVQITHRFGQLVSDGELLEIVGTPRRGPSGLLARVKRVTVEPAKK